MFEVWVLLLVSHHKLKMIQSHLLTRMHFLDLAFLFVAEHDNDVKVLRPRHFHTPLGQVFDYATPGLLSLDAMIIALLTKLTYIAHFPF